ncbi:MAG: SRPBCC domain-containing protein [Hyphomicrobiales bacterium]|nr:SRPBCC domain-containing protein [Hyphomicrobiales bacterium]
MAEATEADNATAVREGSETDRTLVVERIFKAPPDKVFNAWTDPEILVRWWGPEGLHTPEYTMDVREGGAWRTVMMNDKGEAHTASGVYREIAPPKRLVMTWAWEQPDGERGHETLIELSFEPAEQGTRLKLVQRLFADVDARDNHRMGWNSTFSCLEQYFG